MAGYIGRAPATEAIQSRAKYTATNNQTTFSFSYQPGFLDVYLNGVHLEDTTDYTATNGTSIVLTSGASTGQILEAVGLTTFSLVNGKINYTATAAPTAGDDNADGYRVGSMWIDINNDESYRCVDDSTGAAVWVGTTLETSDLGSLALITPSGTGSTSNFLRGDNSWQTVDSLPSQSSQSGKYLTTNGSAASWATISAGVETNLTSTSNIGLGANAVDSITTGDYNVGIGDDAMTATTEGGYNVAVGHEAMKANTTGGNNVSIGDSSMEANTTGSNNVAVGRGAFTVNTEGSDNTAVGKSALDANTTADYNTAVGSAAMGANTTGNKNTAVGRNTLGSNLTGNQNTAMGRNAAWSNTTGGYNVAIGDEALYTNTEGDHNTAVGRKALYAATTASYNVAVGQGALVANTDAFGNTAVGYEALPSNTTQDYNTAVGYRAGASCTTGVGENTFVGREAGEDCSTGEGNTLIGNLAGQNKTGSGSTCIGNKAGKGNASGSNCFIARSDGGPNHSSVWLYGNSSGACYQGNNSSSWTTSSDERIKKDIVDSTDGLAKIDALKVRNFKYRTQEEITAEGLTALDKEGLQTGLIAQEAELVLPNTVSSREDGTKEVSTDPIFWAMVKAIQELSAKNDALEARIKTLEG